MATGQFNKASTAVKAQLLSLQRNFLALASAVGAGTLGLSGFVSKMVATAKETSRATIALKNVSSSTTAFVEAQKWLVDLSKRYGVEINTLTTSFAKFKAAADISNMSLEDQRKVFESVARASVAFGLSAEDQKGVFMALQQMMSKNKVMAEELRLQLTERMPVAIQAMAKAAGVTVSELDTLMKQGKVLSSDVLPKFAEVLNSMIQAPDTDNLNKSLIDLQNTFTSLTKSLNVEGIFKGLVDGVNSMLQSLTKNANGLKTTIASIFAGVAGSKIIGWGKSAITEYEQFVGEAVRLLDQKKEAEKRVGEAEGAVRAATFAKTKALQKQAAAEEAAIVVKTTKYTADAEAEKLRAVRDANRAATEARREASKAEKALKEAEKRYSSEVATKKVIDAKVTAETSERAALKTATGWQKAWNVVSFQAAKAWKVIKGMLVSNAWMVAIGMAMKLGSALWDSMLRLSSIAKQLKQLGNVSATPEMQELDQWQSLLQHKDSSVREGALEKINSILGTQLTLEDDINAEIEKRQKLLLAEARLIQAQEALRAHKEEFGEDLRGSGLNYSKEESTIKTRQEARNKIYKAIADAQEEIAKYSNKTIAIAPTIVPPSNDNSPKIDLDYAMSEVADEEKIPINLKRRIANLATDSEQDPFIKKYIEQTAVQNVLSRQRDKSGDWKLSDTEIKAADLEFEESRIEDLKRLMEEYGVDLGAALSESMANATNLKDVINIQEAQDALSDLQKQMRENSFDMLKDGVSSIDGIVSAFERLGEALDEDASGWERVMAIWGVFSSVAEGVISMIESIAQAQEIAAQMEAAQSAMKVQANAGEAASETGKKIAKESGGWVALAAVPAAIAAILAAFSSIPKFAKGGVVGGTSTQGDKVLARLNSGEGVLTATGLESLHDASNPRNRRNIRVTGTLRGRGRELLAVIEQEDHFTKRIGG